MTAAYRPQADCLAERKNQTVEIAVGFFYFDNPTADWTEVVVPLQWHLDSAYSERIKITPHELMYGFKPNRPLEALIKPAADCEDVPVLREHLRQDAQLAMDFTAAAAKRRYDGKHRPVDFQPGDKVYIKLHHGYHLPGKPSRRFSQKRVGPFKVMERVGRLAYRLDLPDSMNIYPVISVAHLSPHPKGEDPFDRTRVPPGPVEESQSGSASSDGEAWEVERIVDHKKVRGGNKYLIKWKGFGNHENVW
ncbi:hypothetical protein QBC43DRAFT_195406, partial [Cladorrhinum sp. PSN259]